MMLLQAHKPKVKLTERVDPATARLGIYSHGDPEENPHSHLIMVCQVAKSELTDRDKGLSGRPAMWAVEHGSDADYLLLWPRPDADMHAVLRFNPPAKEI